MLHNLKLAIEETYVSQRDAAEAMKMDSGNLSKLINNDNPMSLKRPTKDKIVKTFPKYNIDWILFNKGDKFRKQDDINKKGSAEQLGNPDIPQQFLDEISNIFSRSKSPDKPILPVPVYEQGYIGGQKITKLMNHIDILPSAVLITGKLHIGCDLVIRHCDKAMTRALSIGCYIGIKKIYFFKDEIIEGMMCVIVLNEFTIERFVFSGKDNDHFLLRSADPEQAPDMQVKISRIVELWLIKSFSKPIESEILMF